MKNSIQAKAADAFVSFHGYTAAVCKLRNTSAVSIDYRIGGVTIALSAGESAMINTTASTSEVEVRRTDLSATPVAVQLDFGLDPDEAYERAAATAAASTAAHNADAVAHGLVLAKCVLAAVGNNEVESPADAVTTITLEAATDAALTVIYPYAKPSTAYRLANGPDIDGRSVSNGKGGGTTCVEFRTDAPKVVVAVSFAFGAASVGVVVDGRRVATKLQLGSSGTRYVTISFSDTKEDRLVQVTGHVWLTSIAVAPTYSCRATAAKPELVCVGDSIATGAIQVLSQYGYAFNAARLLGLDFSDLSYSGTGYIKANGADSTYHARWISQYGGAVRNPAVILIQSSTNDMTSTDSEIRVAARAFWAEVRSSFPTVPIFVTGIFGTQSLAARATTEAQILAEFTAWADANSHFIPLYALSSGTGQAGYASVPGLVDLAAVPQSNGNNDRYSADYTHLTEVGHDYFGRYVGREIRKVLVD